MLVTNCLPVFLSVLDFSLQMVNPFSFTVSTFCKLDSISLAVSIFWEIDSIPLAVSTRRIGLRKIPNLTLPRLSFNFQVISKFSFFTKNLSPRLDRYPMDDLHIPGSFIIGSGWSGNETLQVVVLFIFKTFFVLQNTIS